ncbi:MAG: metallophosphoesterase family protein [Chloroflexota bacterium]
MKLAVLSDIHGNLPALEAVADDITRWDPDTVVVNGDVVNGGPRSDLCWQFVRERQQEDGWLVLRGNHEEYVTAWSRPGEPTEGPLYDLSRLSHWTYGQMGSEVAELMDLPERWSWIAPNGERLTTMHASRLGIRRGIYPHTTDNDVRRMIDPEAAVFVTAHTHGPHLRRVVGTQVVNIGSVGLSGDGDQRAAYGRIVWSETRGWEACAWRVAYDVSAAEQMYLDSGFVAEAGPLALMTLVELRTARDAKTRWSAVYREPVLKGEISVAEAVETFLDTPEFQPYWTTEAYFLRTANY